MSALMPITLMTDQSDDATFIGLVNQVIRGAIVRHRPREVCIFQDRSLVRSQVARVFWKDARCAWRLEKTIDIAAIRRESDSRSLALCSRRNQTRLSNNRA